MVKSEPYLIIQTDDPEIYRIEEGITRIGRSSRNKLRLRGKSVSREHCYVERTDDVVRLYYLAPGKLQDLTGKRLADGDVLEVGSWTLVFRHEGRRSAPPPPPASAPEPVVVEVEDRADRTEPPPSRPERESAGGPEPELAPEQEEPAPPPSRLERPQGFIAGAPPIDQRPEAKPRSGPRRRRAGSRRFPLLPTMMACGVLCALAGGAIIGVRMTSAGAEKKTRSAEVEIAALRKRAADRSQALASRLQAIQEELDDKLRKLDAIRRQAERTERENERLRRAQGKRLLDVESALTRQAATERRKTNERLAALQESIARLRKEKESLSARQAASRPPRTARRRENGPERRGEERSDRRGDVVARTGSPARPRPETRIVREGSLPRREIAALVKKLKQALDDYGNPSADVESLEPHLGKLSGSTGRYAAGGMLEVGAHSTKLLRDLDRTMRFLGKRNEYLERQARVLTGLTRDQREQAQRLYELSAKKIEILRRQRSRLVAMRTAVLDATRKVNDLEATIHMAGRFPTVHDPGERRAILGAFAAGRARHAIPLLIRSLSARGRRGEVHRTLRDLAGIDLGTGRSDWEKWWKTQEA